MKQLSSPHPLTLFASYSPTINGSSSVSSFSLPKLLGRSFFILLLSLVAVWAQAARSITSISIGAQSGSVTYGTAGSVTFPITFAQSGGGSGSSTISINWTTPTGVTTSFPVVIDLSSGATSTTLTINTSASTPAGSTSFTVSSSNNAVTSASANFVVSPRAVTVSGATASNKVYNGNTNAVVSGGSLTGVLAGDVGNVSVSSVGTFADKNVANGKIVNVALTGSAASNYSVTQPGITANITPLAITISGTRAYDGTTTAAAGILTVTNNFDGANLTLSGSGTLAGATVGSHALSVGTLALGGSAAGNYTLTGFSGSVSITPRPVVLSGTRVYDGTTSAASGILTISNNVDGANLTISGTGTLASANVGSRAISAGSLVLGGSAAGNYTLTGLSGSVSITALPVILSGTRAYDGTTTAAAAILTITNNLDGANLTLSGNGTLSGSNVGSRTISAGTLALGGSAAGNYTLTGLSGSVTITPRAVTLSGTRAYDGTATAAAGILTITNNVDGANLTLSGTGTLASANVGSRAISAGTLALGGSASGNYTLTGLSGSVTITTLAVTLSGTKPYDGTTAAAAGILTITNNFDGANLTLSGSGTLSSANVGSRTISAGTLALGGSAASNYTLTGLSGSVSITARAVTLTGTKVYDNTTAAPAAILTISNNLDGANLTLSGSGVLASENVGSQAISAGTLALGGSAAGNYTLVGIGGSVNITARPLTITAIASSKVYDGTISSPSIPNVTAGTIQSGDVAAFIETYNDKNVGTGKTLIPSGIVNDGNGGANYSYTFVNYTSNPAANRQITARPITVTATTNTKGYDGTTSAAATPTITVGAIQTGDVANFIEVYNNKNVGVNKTLTPSGSVTDGNSGGNYSVTFVNNTTGVITAQALTVTAVTNTKTYNGTTAAAAVPTVTSGTIQAGDTYAPTETYDTRNVGTNKTLIPAGVVADGNGGNNYSYTYVNNTTGVINSMALTITGAANTKTFDGNTSSATNPTITTGAVQTGDVAAFTQTYDNKNVGTGKTMTPTGVVTDGNGGNNYTYNFVTSNNGTINARPLTITAVGNSKEYDGTTSAAAVPNVTGGIQSGDVANFIEVYDNKNAGTGKTLIPSGSVIDGNGGNNYSYNFVNLSTGSPNLRQITAHALTVTAVTNSKGYDGTTSAAATPTITSGTIQTGDVANFSEAYADKNVGTNKVIIPSGTVTDGNSGNNYTYTFVNNTTGVITAQALTVTAVTNTKLYDGNTSAAAVPVVTAGAVQTGDVANFIETYDNASVGTGKTLTPSGSVTDGNGGANYTYNFVNNNTGVITGFAIATADFRSKQSGNFSTAANWEYDQGGASWITATAAPTSGNNVTIRNGHNMVQNINFTVGAGKTFMLDATSSLTINPNNFLTIAGTADFNNQPVTIKSTSAGTGAIGEISGTLSNATNVTAECYISAVTTRRYHFLTAPISGISINNAWQRYIGGAWTGSPDAGNGTQTLITGGLTPDDFVTANSAGFDWWAPGSSSSVYRYTGGVSGGTYQPLANTNNTLNGTNAYLLFVRGDRSKTNAPASGATTLTPTGTLKQGTINGITVYGSSTFSHTPIGNPYPAPLSFASVYANNNPPNIIKNLFWIWDPSVGTTGGYKLVVANGGVYDVIPSPYSGTPDNSSLSNGYIQSGQAVFVEPVGSGDASISIMESDKASGASTLPRLTPLKMTPRIRINLSQDNGGIADRLSDGVVTQFSDNYTYGVNDEADIRKAFNNSENLSVFQAGKELIMEGRPQVTDKDTLYLHLTNTSVRNYHLQLKGENMQLITNGLTAILQDTYTGASVPVSLDNGDITTYRFAIGSDAASKSSNRFRVVFKANQVLPVVLKNARAFQQGAFIQVDWQTSNEQNMRSYEIEKSADGQLFAKAGTVMAAGNNATNNYNWLDQAPVNGNNYYRIKSIALDGSVSYSQVLVVKIGTGVVGSFTINPNPVKGRTIGLQFVNLEKGQYTVSIYNQAGQLVSSRRITHLGGSSSESFQLETQLASGVYKLNVLSSKGIVFQETVLIQN